MHLSPLVVGGWILLQPFGNRSIQDLDPITRFCRDDQFENVQQLPGISTGIAEQGIRFSQDNLLLLQLDILRQGPMQQIQQILFS